jgi:hypothetical protein
VSHPVVYISIAINIMEVLSLSLLNKKGIGSKKSDIVVDSSRKYATGPLVPFF